ncbi:MAG: aldo/keto reductase [Anaerolineae bacterium]|nr:aldo/keto reductase [Anaerolineae bacterium]
MEKRCFGKTGLDVTILGYGAMELRHVDEAQAEKLLNAALDAGITFIDTAPDYGPSEDYIGQFIAHRRNEYILATKCGCNIPYPSGSDAPRHIWTGVQLRHNIEHSLRRLCTDYVDVWQIHSAYPQDLAGTDVLETMFKIQEEGKVRHIAVSMGGASEKYGYVQMRGYLDPVWDAFEAMQVWYSALVRYSEQAIREAARKGIGTIIRGATRRVDPWTSLEDACTQLNLDALRAPGESAAQFLLRFVVSHPDVHTIIVGTKNLDHIAENVTAVESGPLPADVLVEAKKRLDVAKGE